jgi:hypothetical protein
MPVDVRDEIWSATYETYYDTFFEELIAECLVSRWLVVDHVSRILVAVTASGSTVAGLALWKNPAVAWLWPILSGVSAVLAILTDKLGVSQTLKSHNDAMNAFCSLRVDLETFRYRMRANPDFDVPTFQRELVAYRKRYGDDYKRVQADILRRRNLEKKVQSDLNDRLRGYGAITPEE